ncbi:glycoside hydrolase family 9 protein, partial [Nocardioides stalactiti]|uniref:glycoside hydrolase family 9 protein n=1 Tax=Nocardioides stalactiti TaxID=2755356 RepID=UPI0015FF905D
MRAGRRQATVLGSVSAVLVLVFAACAPDTPGAPDASDPTTASGAASPADAVNAANLAAAPALKIRVALVAAPGNIPPAVVGSPTSLTGTTYRVYDGGGTQVKTGTLAKATLAPSEYRDAKEVWPHFATASLAGLGAGRYQVRVNGVSSSYFTVKATAWQDVLKTLLPIYRSNADGAEPASPYHGPSHLNDVASPISNGPHLGEPIDVRGGWMDAGDQLKFTMTIAYATAMLELAGRNEAGLRDELWAKAAIGVRFLLKAHPTSDLFVAQVGNVDADHNSGFRDPATDDASADPSLAHRKTYVLTGTTGGSDVAAITAAALALAARHATGAYRTTLITAAEQWLTRAEQLKKVWTNCCYQQDS